MEVSRKRIRLKGLLMHCPFGEAHEQCAIKGYRSLPIQDRMDLVGRMPRTTLDALFSEHARCREERQAARPDIYR